MLAEALEASKPMARALEEGRRCWRSRTPSWSRPRRHRQCYRGRCPANPRSGHSRMPGRAGGGGSPWTLAWITRSRRTARDYDRLTAHQQVMVQAVEL